MTVIHIQLVEALTLVIIFVGSHREQHLDYCLLGFAILKQLNCAIKFINKVLAGHQASLNLDHLVSVAIVNTVVLIAAPLHIFNPCEHPSIPLTLLRLPLTLLSQEKRLYLVEQLG